MDGFYIYCRAWIKFHDSFPWFDNLNPLPDEEIIGALNSRARTWLKDNRAAARGLYRRAKHRVQETLDAVRSMQSQITLPPNPRLNLRDQAHLHDSVRVMPRTVVIQHAERMGIQLGMPLPEIRRAVAKRLKREIEVRMIHERYRPSSKEAVRSPMLEWRWRARGIRQNASLEVRIARLAHWVSKEFKEFGGISPTPKLMLKWVPNRKGADAILAVARARFDQGELPCLMVRFGAIPMVGVPQEQLAIIEVEKAEQLAEHSRRPEKVLFQDIQRLFDEAVKVYERFNPSLLNPVALAVPLPIHRGVDHETKKKRRKKLVWLAEAMSLKLSHPNLLDKEIAKRVGVDPAQLARSYEYQQIKKSVVGTVDVVGRGKRRGRIGRNVMDSPGGDG